MRVPLRRRRSRPRGVLSATSADRFASRTRRRRAGRAMSGLVAVAVAGLLGGLVWAVGWSDLLVLDDVRVEGADAALAASVLDAAAAPVGTPLARVATAELGERVAALPEVARVDVGRSWPRTLVVEVTPRVPVAAVVTDEGERVVDAEGVVFGGAAEEGLPRLEADPGADGAAARAAGVRVIADLPAELAARVRTVRADSGAAVLLVLDDGASVQWGAPERAERKAEVLLALLAQEAQAYDVSAPDRPTIRP